MAVRFLAVGELLVDVIAAGAGHGARIRVRPAGSGFNAAVAAVAAGAEASVIGTVGDDAAGRMIVRELEAHGVRPLISVEGVTGTFLLADGEIRVDRGDAHRPGPSAVRRGRPRLGESRVGRARRGPPRRAAARRECVDRERGGCTAPHRP
jgi:hypothetical protein